MTRLSARVAMAAWVWLAAGCGGPPAPRQARQIADPGPEIEALIEKLAISEAPAAEAPVYSPDIDTPKAGRRVIALDAGEKLKAYGKTAFPYLLRHLDDKRQSEPRAPWLRFDVGAACWCIIDEQIFAAARDYLYGYGRVGADGKDHMAPRFFGAGEFYGKGIASWLKACEDKSLSGSNERISWNGGADILVCPARTGPDASGSHHAIVKIVSWSHLAELQREALEWLIAQEKKIGFQKEEDKKRYLDPLERELERLKGKARTGRARAGGA